MKPRSPMRLVDELGRLAADAESPAIDDAATRRMIDRALRGAAFSAAPVPARSSWTLGFAIAAAVALAVWWLAPRATVAPSEPSVMRVTLPTGDRLVGVAGAQFELEQLASDDRRIVLRSGIVMFDVAHVVAHQRFQVTTPHLVAIARGTVFSVETDATHSRVRVYEGIVEVQQDGGAQLVVAGGVWDSTTRMAAVALDRPVALAASVELAVAERVAAARPVVAIAPPPVPSAVSTPPTPVVHEPAPVAVAAPPRSRESLDQLFASARADVDAGRLEAALATAHLAAARSPWSGPWWQLVGDASRGLGHMAEAADAFDHAAHDLTGPERSEASYTSAYLRFHELLDGDSALTSLDAAGTDSEGSPLEERALGLRVQILEGLGHHDLARASATHYLERFPHADLRAYMLALTK